MNMKWKVLQGGLLLLLCDVLTVTEAKEEKNLEGHVTKREVRVPPQALRHLAVPATTTDYNDTSVDDPQVKVSLPSMDCTYDIECWQVSNTLPLVCHDGQCTCRPPQCWVYRYIVTGTFTAKNEFTCGQCGVLGSSCNATIQCDSPGECWSDGYCHCPSGENYDGVCLTSNLSWTSTLAFSAMGIVFAIAMCVMGINCYKRAPWRNPDAWRCGCCRRVVSSRQQRRGSCEKTPAFTIQAHYASQDLASPQEDAPSASPSGLGGAVPRRPRTPSTNSGTVSSISSANTNMTTVSGSASDDSTARTPPRRPAPSPPSPSPPPSPPLSSQHPTPPPPLSSLSLSSPTDPTLSSPLTPSPSTSLLPPHSSSSSIPSVLPHTLATSPPLPPPPPYLPRQESSHTRGVNEGRENCSSHMQVSEVLSDGSNLQPSTPKSTSEIGNIPLDSNGGCTHERCQLCLPKAPASAVSAPPRRRTSDRHGIDGRSPLLPRAEGSHPHNSIELTQL